MNGIGTWNLVSYLIDKLGVGGTPAATAVTMGGIFLCIIVPYLLGSLNFGVMTSSKQYRDDVRTHGSGNAGATNMLRTFGWKAAVLTMAGDMLKAVLAVGLGYLIVGVNAQITAENGMTYRMVDQFGAAIAGLFVMLGHMFPIFFKFKGGKGVATSGMVIIMISPITAAICFVIFLIIVIDGVLDCAVNLTAVTEDTFDFFFAVMDGLHVEAVIVTDRQRIKDSNQTTDRIIHRGKQFTIRRGILTALQILAATHGEVEFHVLAS